MSDWRSALAEEILEDRVDRGETPAQAARRADRYAAWLDRVSLGRHDRPSCPDESDLARWPGDLGFHTGQATVFVARQGAGKSNALAVLIEKAVEHRPGWDIYTNVPFPWTESLAGTVPAPPNLYPVSSFAELLRGIGRSILADRIPAVAIDEMDQAATSHEWAGDRSESWTKFLYVERHFRVRGPMLAYHVYEHVPLPLRRTGALRGSYFRVVIRGGLRLLARAEDPSAWWVVPESSLPFLTLGHHGFDLDVDMADLGRHLSGNHKAVARQMLEYLDELAARRKVEAEEHAAEVREAHRDAWIHSEAAVAERQVAFDRRNEEIVALLLERPESTNAELTVRYHVSRGLLARLRAVAEARRTDPPASVRGSGVAT